MDAFLSRWAVGDPALVPEGLDPTIAYCIGYAILGVSTFVFSGLRYVWAQLIGLSASCTSVMPSVSSSRARSPGPSGRRLQLQTASRGCPTRRVSGAVDKR